MLFSLGNATVSALSAPLTGYKLRGPHYCFKHFLNLSILEVALTVVAILVSTVA